MQYAQDTFISSTFWTERIGPTAALKTLEIMHRDKSWEYVTDLGKYLKGIWIEVARSNKLSITINGIYPLLSFKFNSPNHQEYKTLITQEMLKYGSATNTCYFTAHSKNIIDEYAYFLNKVFKIVLKCEQGESVKTLTTEVSHSTFQRLN